LLGLNLQHTTIFATKPGQLGLRTDVLIA
jgi:hypothetical protein